MVDRDSVLFATHTPKPPQFLLLLPLLAVRLALCLLFLPLVTAVAAALTAGCPPDAPLPPVRSRVARAFLSAWARFLLAAGFAVFPKLEGGATLATAPPNAIYVFNHVSYLDGLLLAACLRAPSALAKAGLAHAPCLGPWTQALQCAYVDRRGVGGGTVAALTARASDARAWPPLAVAPEGTTKPSPCLLRFRSGAFAAALAAGGVPVIPVALDYRWTRVNPGWGVMHSTLTHVLRLQARFDTRARVHVLPPVWPSPGDTPTAYAERVRGVLARALGVPTVDAGLEEWGALKAARVAVDWTGTRVLVNGAPLRGVVDVHAKEA